MIFFVNIVNIETSTEDFNIVPRRQGTFKVNAKEISGHVAEYLIDAYRQCRINQSDNSNKIINISLKSLDGWYSFNSGATLKLSVSLPEKNQTLSFTTQQSAIDIQRAVAYAIHVISWDIVRDPTIQDYVLCK